MNTEERPTSDENKLSELQNHLMHLADMKKRRMNEETDSETKAYYRGKMHAYATVVDMIDMVKERD